jgi:hypothetical protein
MSYADDVRGALAATSGASRRSQALHDLGMTPDDTAEIQGCLDDARNALLGAVDVLKRTGNGSPSLNMIASGATPAGADKSWRETVYGGKKDSTGTRAHVKGRPRTYDEVFDPDNTTEILSAREVPVPTVEVDISHPWRTEERTS